MRGAAGRDMATGLVLALLALGLLWVIPDQIAVPEDSSGPSPAFLPLLAAQILLGLALCLVLFAFLAPPADEAGEEETGFPFHALAVTAVVAGLIALMPAIGFPLSGALALAILAPLFGERRPLAILLLAVVTPMLLYLFFRHGMLVLLPTLLPTGPV